MKRSFVILIFLAAAQPARSQVQRQFPIVLDPATWLSGSIGLFNGDDVSDGNTGSTWDLGRASNPLYRLSVEHTVSRNTSAGLTGTFVRAPFTYIGAGGDNSCARCAAHLNMISAGLSAHHGGGIGLHQVLEATAGALQYRNLKRDVDGAPLGPVNGNVDPYFTFGYGFGYTFTPRTEISIVQDFGLALHEREGLTSEQSNTLTQRTLRLNARFGFGKRKP